MVPEFAISKLWNSAGLRNAKESSEIELDFSFRSSLAGWSPAKGNLGRIGCGILTRLLYWKTP